MRVLGPIYELDDRTRLQDVDAGCGTCGKRLARVIHDPRGNWPQGRLVCIDCGTLAPEYAPPLERALFRLVPSYRAPGHRLACCTLCKWNSGPLTAAEALRFGLQHLSSKHPEQAA